MVLDTDAQQTAFTIFWGSFSYNLARHPENTVACQVIAWTEVTLTKNQNTNLQPVLPVSHVGCEQA